MSNNLAQAMNSNIAEMKRNIYPQIKAMVSDEATAKSVYASVVRLATNPKIAVCDPSSMALAFTQAIDLGLKLDPTYGECDFIPYSKKVQINGEWVKVNTLTFQVRAKGIAVLAEREGGWEMQILPVFNCDTYEVEQVFNGNWLEEKITFKPNIDQREEHAHDENWVFNNLRLVLANARRMHNGRMETFSLTMTRNMVEARRLMSQAQKATTYSSSDDKSRLQKGLPIGIWAEHYTAMATKTAMAALARKLPKTKRVEQALRIDFDDSKTIDSTSTTVTETSKAEPLTLTEIPSNTVDFNVDAQTGEVLIFGETETGQLTYTGNVEVLETKDIDWWTVEVDSAATNAELTELLAEIPDNVKLDLEHVIDAKFDSFAKPEASKETASKQESAPAPLDKYTDLRIALNECDSQGAFAMLINNMDAKTKAALAEEIKATNNRIKQAQATEAA